MIRIAKSVLALILLFFVHNVGAYYPGLLTAPEAAAINAVNAKRLADPILNPYVPIIV